MALGYCFGCGIRVSTVDIEAGIGKRFDRGLSCQACAKSYEEAIALASQPQVQECREGRGQIGRAHV